MKVCILKSFILILVFCSFPISLNAGVAGKSVEEAWEFIAKKFFREIAEEGGEKILQMKFKSLAAKYGDEAILAIRKVGPKGIDLVERYGDDALRQLNKHGDEALFLLQRSGDEVIPLVKQFGDDAVVACIKHPGVGKNFIKEFGKDGINIANQISTDSVIKLLKNADKIKKSGKAEEIFKIILKYGDKAVTHIDKHKLLYLGGYALSEFLENPEKYLDAASKATADGARRLVLGPSSQSTTPFNYVFAFLVIVVPICLWIFLKHRKTNAKTSKDNK
jgi:hypothetical protein